MFWPTDVTDEPGNARRTALLEIFIGVCIAVLSLLPKSKFYEGRLGTKQVLPSIEPRRFPGSR